MPADLRRLGPEEIVARNEAQRLLRLLDVSTVQARWASASRESLRAAYVERYRLLFGVEPDHHEVFRAALESVAAGGGQSVAEVRAILQAGINR